MNAENVEIIVNSSSFDEARGHIADSISSTEVLLMLKYILENATIERYDDPKEYQNKYEEIIILSCYVPRIGKVKLTVGIRKSDGEYVQYCVRKWEFFDDK